MKLENHSQVHTKVGTMKFEQSKEGPHCHQFGEEFITWTQNNQETQPLGTVEDNVIGCVGMNAWKKTDCGIRRKKTDCV